MTLVEKNFSNRVLRARDASAYLGIGESTFWRWVQTGRIPRGMRLSARATVWRVADLEAFLEQQASSSQGGVQ